MTRLFGCICNQPDRVAQALEPVHRVLVASAPISRWGIGYVHAGEVLLSLTPRRSEQDIDFYEHLSRLRSDYLIGHATADDGLTGNINTQPFRFRRWLFAQEGTVEDLGRIQTDLLEGVPDFLRRNLKGKTPAEHVFYTFMSMLQHTKSIEDPNLPLLRIREALHDALVKIHDVLRKAGARASGNGGVLGSLGNLITSNARSLVAVRLSKPLYMRRLSVLSSDRPNAGKDSTFRGVLAVSSDSHPGEGFEEIPERSALLISREINAEIVPLQP